MTITLSASTSPVVALLANVLFDAFDSTAIKTTGFWPFSPDSLDFSQIGDIAININGPSALVVFSFRAPNSPQIEGTLDLTKLEAQLVGAPNYVDFVNSSQVGPIGTAVFTTPAITRMNHGVCFVTVGASGSQSSQQLVQMDLYRDFGTLGQTHLAGPWSSAPGGVGAFNWLGRITKIDVLPDSNPHTYSLVCAGQGGSQVTTPANAATLQAFEIGALG